MKYNNMGCMVNTSIRLNPVQSMWWGLVVQHTLYGYSYRYDKHATFIITLYLIDPVPHNNMRDLFFSTCIIELFVRDY